MSLIGSIASGIGSFASKAFSAIKPYAGAIVGGAVGGPAGAMLGQQVFSSTPNLPAIPGGGSKFATLPRAGMTNARSLTTGTSTQALVMSGGYSPASVSRINRAAGSMCSKYPQWCMQMGGVGQVAQAMATGQLPIPRRRRRRGITPRDLQSFRRVANLIKCYSAPVHRMRTARHCKTPKRG